MAYHDNRPRHSKSTPQSSKRGVTSKKNGFAQLDPSQMGMDMPDWLSETTETAGDVKRPRSDSGSTVAPQPSARTLLEGLKVVCICKGIKMRTFWRVMDDGAQTHEQIDQATGSGSGQCQGRRCGPRILEMLRNLPR